MRLKFGRPDITRYADRFDLPAAAPGAPLRITWLGVTTLLIDDGESALMTDGFFTRPSLPTFRLRRIAPSQPRIQDCLARAGVRQLEAVIAVHTHYDHVMDSAAVADRTEARLIGSASAANIGRGHGLSADRIVVATPGKTMSFGTYDVTLLASHHSQPDRFPGFITEPLVAPVNASAYQCGEAWSTLVHHRHTDRRLLIQGSAGFIPGALAGQRADVAYLGVLQLGYSPRDYLLNYWNETVRTVGARRVILIHWDDLFSPLNQPLKPFPHIGDDLDATMNILSELADQDGIPLHLPTVWQPADP
ncbi:MAG TPA: MBL fold metallo-hydrolase [Streptosporangiaceae bacterium]|nr:MBL fold metallo-hydrolase [Streptosporangiaceae bacterium]